MTVVPYDPDHQTYPLYQVLAVLHASPSILMARHPERSADDNYADLRRLGYRMKGFESLNGYDRNWMGLENELAAALAKSHRTRELVAAAQFPEEAQSKYFRQGSDPKRMEILDKWITGLEEKFGKEIQVPNFTLARENVPGWSYRP